jgi:hypothetical protein
MKFLQLFCGVIAISICYRTANAQFSKASLSDMNIVSECDYCGCAQGISPMQTGSTGIRFDFGSLYLGAPFNGSAKMVNPGNQHESFLTNRLTFNYRFGESPITVSGSVPYVSRQSFEPGDGITPNHTFDGQGIGDISALVRYNNHYYEGEAMIAYSVSAGVKFPTGKNDIKVDDSTYLDPDLQPGTGSMDIIIGAAGFWSQDAVGIFGYFNFGFVTGGGAPESDGKHKYGNYLLAEVTGTYRIIPSYASMSNLSVTLGLGFDGRLRESEGGTPIDASGGYLVFLAPGLKYLISMGLQADASIQIPIHQYLNADPVNGGFQLGQNYRFLFGMQYSL